MTREEAIDIFKHITTIIPSENVSMDEVETAVDMAISALEQEPNKSEIPTSCDDAISRSTAKTRIYLKYVNRPDICKAMFKILDGVPSVQPSRRKGHWIDREEYDSDRWKCFECGRTEQYQENFCPN